MEKTAGILVIGNEVLSGKVTDLNSPYLCRELRGLGVNVRQLNVLRDDEQTIADQVRAWRGHNDYMFICGGVGPTPDDVTIAGVARGLDRPVIRHEVLSDLIRKHYLPPHTEAMLKMSEIPEGAELLHSEGLRFPVITIAQIYIFPGVPEILQKKFRAIRERFRDHPYFLKKVFVNAPEVEFSHCLSELLQAYPRLALGSYPISRSQDYQVVVTLESKDPAYVDQALAELLRKLPDQSLVKTE